MGASANDGATSTLPIFISLEPSKRFHVGGIDFDADRLADQIHRQDQPRVGALAHQPSRTPFNGPCVTSTIIAFPDQRARIVLQVALDQPADAVDLDAPGIGDDLAVERDDGDDAGAFQDGQPFVGVEAREAVAGKQRPVDLLLAILPAAPAGNRRQKRLEPFRSSCSRTTCSWRERVQTAYHAGASCIGRSTAHSRRLAAICFS